MEGVDGDLAEISSDTGCLRDKVALRLQKRSEDILKKKEDRENASVILEQTDYFTQTFNKAKLDVESQLAASDTLEKAKLNDHFDGMIISLQKLTKFLTDSAVFLRPYEVEKAHETLGKLYANVQEKRESLAPKKKFAFKSKKKESSAHKPTPSPPVTRHKKFEVEMTDCRFSEMSDVYLSKGPGEVNFQDVALSMLKGCEVWLQGSPSAIHISNLKGCKVFSGPVSGSIFIDDCCDCTFVLACQQLRIHKTTQSDFYIHVTSKAIIEDCHRVRFSDYSLDYPALMEHYQLSGLDQARNNWRDVDDFNWLASDSPSPNWEVIPVADKVLSWDLSKFKQ